ncbi:MAG: phage integrase SAM-like domain-containing protein, partial [Alphaproteobacteria bacterium]|nr:phage integrase SAM-like domain-containing protein [Alphaproteobacteria bacterium]
MKTKFYLDCRNSEVGTLKIALTHKCNTRHISLDVHLFPNQWDGEKIVNHKNKVFLNTYITRRKVDIDTALFQLRQTVNFNQLSINEIKAMVIKEVSPNTNEAPANNFVARFRHFAATHKEHTEKIYLHTLKRMTDFCPELNTLNFEDINKDWIVAFDSYLSKTMPSKNARNVHLRNIRAVFN